MNKEFRERFLNVWEGAQNPSSYTRRGQNYLKLPFLPIILSKTVKVANIFSVEKKRFCGGNRHFYILLVEIWNPG